MRRVCVTFVSVLLIAQFVYPQSGESTSNSIKLGYVRDFDYGCGCYFSYNSSNIWKDKNLFVSSIEEDTVVINVDGKDVKLRSIAQSKDKMDEKVGDRSWETYIAGDLKVRLDYVVTKVCDPNDESCESTRYRATLTVMRGKQRRVINGAAICGC